MGFFNDNTAGIDENGYLTLGVGQAQSVNRQGPISDGQADATYNYMKGDFWMHVSPIRLPGGVVGSGSVTEANVRAAAGMAARSYTAGAAAASTNIIVPISEYLPFHRIYATQPHGFKLINMILSYAVATAAATSVAVVFNTETPQTNNTARSAASTTPLGAITYQNPPGTAVAALPVAIQANQYVCQIVPGTPVAVTTDRQTLTAEIQLSLAANGVLTITEVAFHFALGLY
jgi:hypothetical protein